MQHPTSVHISLVLAFAGLLTACSNGRGSVGEGSSPVGQAPGAPADPAPAPTPAPTPPEPAPTPPPPPPPSSSGWAFAGYWKGTVVRLGDDDGDDDDDEDDDGRWTRNATALIDQRGDAQLIVHDGADSFVVHGDLCCRTSVNQKLDSSRYLQTRVEKTDLRASLSGGALAGEFEFRSRTYRYSLGLDGAWNQSLSVQTLAGVYTRTTTTAADAGLAGTLTLAVSANGQVSGSHSNGCIFNGTVAISDPAHNMARWTMNVAACGREGSSSRRWNGDYTGLGVLLRDAPAPNAPGAREDALALSLVGPTWLGLWSLAR